MSLTGINPNDVREILGKHILTDGFNPIFDIENSRGSWFVDQRDGREYLDLFSFFASSPIGFNHPYVLQKREWLGKVAVNKPTNSDVYTTVYADFVERFSEVGIPDTLPHAFFIEGGALGVENALKTAFDWKIRKNIARGVGERGFKVIHFTNAFHGRTGYTLSLTNTFDPNKTKYFPVFDWPRIEGPVVTFPIEDNLESIISAEKNAILKIKDSISREPDDIAALIIEPVQSEGGDNHFRKEFFRELRVIADESEIMLIFDEVQTGVGLTGTFWAHEHFNVIPDMISFGKKMQVCGFLCGKRVEEVEENVFVVPSRINSTFGGNIVDMARNLLYLDVIRDEGLVDNAATVGRHLLYRLQALQDEFEGKVSNARGLGLLCAFDLPSEKERDEVVNKIIDAGAIILGSGERTVRFRPPLNISTNEIDVGIDIIHEVLSGYSS